MPNEVTLSASVCIFREEKEDGSDRLDFIYSVLLMTLKSNLIYDCALISSTMHALLLK